MPAPYKQALTIAVNALRSGAALITDTEIRSILFDANLTGTSFYLEGASVAVRAGSGSDQPAEANFKEMRDSADARVSFTRYASKLIVLSEAQRNHFKGGHYVRLVASEPQATNAAVITLIGNSMYS